MVEISIARCLFFLHIPTKPNLKQDIIRRIKAVKEPELQTILDLRYLAYMRWEQIAIELDYGIDNVYILHRKALDQITVPETLQ